MIRLAYLADECFEDASGSEDRAALLLSILQALLQNCLLLDFEDYRFSRGLIAQVKRVHQAWQKPISAVLARFNKRNRIFQLVVPDYVGNESDAQSIQRQAQALGLDLVVVRSLDDWERVAPLVQTLTSYHASHFESDRQELFAGRIFADNEIPGTQFIDRYLAPLLRFTETVDIVDGGMAVHPRDEYLLTVERVLAAIVAVGDRIKKVTVHSEDPSEPKQEAFLVAEIKKRAARVGLKAKIAFVFYRHQFRFKGLLHDRFLGTDVGLAVIGRGFDFLASPSVLRNTFIGYLQEQPRSVLQAYDSFRREVV